MALHFLANIGFLLRQRGVKKNVAHAIGVANGDHGFVNEFIHGGMRAKVSCLFWLLAVSFKAQSLTEHRA
jgi:hypothetical protein